MRLVIDIDGVIAKTRKDFDFENSEVMENATESVNKFFNEGHFIIFHTARPRCDYTKTVMWLIEKGFKFHQLVMDKPLGDVYIDDRAFHFENWDETIRRLLHGSETNCS